VLDFIVRIRLVAGHLTPPLLTGVPSKAAF
jgi:hypothetical protein